ncbi:MAG: hypothetical protein FJW20_00270 [Acidimicrobiia bacterium]|nr:hypothetical protein [Acidimicrobiia bacterium]
MRLHPAAAAIAVLTLAGFFLFPGHTWLQQDTQIWAPMLQRLADPSLLAADPVATRPHVAYTVYDEISVGLSRLTGGDFYPGLMAQQLITRAMGLLGASLLARAAGLSWLMSLLVASLFGLGATIAGPSVLTIEYEPVPRGLAGPLVILAAGLAAQHRWIWAGAACGASILYHPPTAAPFCAVFLLMVITGKQERVERLKGLVPIAVAALLIGILSRIQAGLGESQQLFSTIDAELEQLQRLRGSYNWISKWDVRWIRHYELLYVVSLAAFLRLSRAATGGLRYVMAGIPLYGLLSIPLSYALLEGWKWSLIPQFQPARATMLLVAVTVTACGIAGARATRFWESAVWFAIAFAVPTQTEVMQLLLPDLRQPLIAKRVAIVMTLAVTAALAARWETRRPRLGLPCLAAAVALPLILIPGPGEVKNYPNLDHPEIHSLAAWAREQTDPAAVFQFADAGKNLQPGLFRAHAKRALYVDWKSGGQVNLLKEFALEWWRRWQQTMEGKFDPTLRRYEGIGIDYVVVGAATKVDGREPVFGNARYRVYRLGPQPGF